MENRILNELDEDILDHISGGTKESEISYLTQMFDYESVICSNCGARVVLGGGPCSRCGVTPAKR